MLASQNATSCTRSLECKIVHIFIVVVIVIGHAFDALQQPSYKNTHTHQQHFIIIKTHTQDVSDEEGFLLLLQVVVVICNDGGGGGGEQTTIIKMIHATGTSSWQDQKVKKIMLAKNKQSIGGHIYFFFGGKSSAPQTILGCDCQIFFSHSHPTTMYELILQQIASGRGGDDVSSSLFPFKINLITFFLSMMPNPIQCFYFLFLGGDVRCVSCKIIQFEMHAHTNTNNFFYTHNFDVQEYISDFEIYMTFKQCVLLISLAHKQNRVANYKLPNKNYTAHTHCATRRDFFFRQRRAPKRTYGSARDTGGDNFPEMRYNNILGGPVMTTHTHARNTVFVVRIARYFGTIIKFVQLLLTIQNAKTNNERSPFCVVQSAINVLCVLSATKVNNLCGGGRDAEFVGDVN